MSSLTKQLVGKNPVEVTKSVVGVLLVVAVVYLLVKELSPSPHAIPSDSIAETKSETMSETKTTTASNKRVFPNAHQTNAPTRKGSIASISGRSGKASRKSAPRPKQAPTVKKTLQPESVSREDEGARPTPERPLIGRSRIVYEGGFKRLFYDRETEYDIVEIPLPPNTTRYTHRLLGNAKLYSSSAPEEDQHFVLTVSSREKELLRTPLTPLLLKLNGSVTPFQFDCCTSITYTNTTNVLKFIIRYNQTNSTLFVYAASVHVSENESSHPLSVRLGTNKPGQGSFAFLDENVLVSE